MVTFRLLDRFQAIFDGVKYRHRSSTSGDKVAACLYEDLYALSKSKELCLRIAQHRVVVNTQNQRRGIKARRGDGTFGELIPGLAAVVEMGFGVARGEISNVEIGVEVKILAKAMDKQRGRVENDLRDQARQFRTRANNPVCIGIVGINYADVYVSYEGDRSFRTDGSATYRHPAQEAAAVEGKLSHALYTTFDELLFLRYRATNEPPYPFKWVNPINVRKDYGAALARISDAYDTRFS